IADVTTSLLSFPSGVKAHIFVSWLHPFKEQKLVVVGDRKMAVFDDVDKRINCSFIRTPSSGKITFRWQTRPMPNPSHWTRESLLGPNVCIFWTVSALVRNHGLTARKDCGY